MMTKEGFVNRPEDIDLGWIFNDMRRAQRERDWTFYYQNSMVMQSQNLYSMGHGYTQSLGQALFGKGF